MNKSRHTRKRTHKPRLVLIRLITLSFPLLLLLLLEGGLRLFSYGDRLDLFMSNPREGYEQYLIVNPSIGKKYFQKFEYDSPANDIFLKKKPEGSFRIFVMGSSTVVGFPYGDNLMFSRILHRRLEEVYPGQHIEVINTAITAINSFTLLDYADEIVKHKPDAVLIYAGHNEFYGAFGAGSNESMSKSRTLTRMHLFLMDFRFYQLFRNLTNLSLKKVGNKSDQVHGTLMKRIVGNTNIDLDSDTYELAMLRYRQNMGKLISTFHQKDIPVFLSELVSNVKDIKPLSAASSGKADEAKRVFESASLAYEQEKFEEARRLFYEAKDLDGIRFRASEEVNQIIGDLSLEFDTYKVPMIEFFQSRSPNGIIGSKLLTEHVHPNIEGYFIMADAFFSEIVSSEILGLADIERGHSMEYHRRNWGYTALDSLRAHHMVTNLMNYWPFVPVNAEGNDYRRTYRPQSKLDSLAFGAFVNPKTDIIQVRLQLAEEYDEAGKLEAAFVEHESIVCTNPYMAINYRGAATHLLNMGDLPRALVYFKKSLIYEASFYASFRMGEIYLIKGDYPNARKYFEMAFSLTAEEQQKLKTLGKIYMSCVYGGQGKDAQALAQQLRKYSANQYLKIPKKSYTYLNYIPFKTRGQVEAALEEIKEGRLEEARLILEKSLEVYDSHVARRYLGDIMLEQGKNQEAKYQFDRVYDEFRFDPIFVKKYK